MTNNYLSKWFAGMRLNTTKHIRYHRDRVNSRLHGHHLRAARPAVQRSSLWPDVNVGPTLYPLGGSFQLTNNLGRTEKTQSQGNTGSPLGNVSTTRPRAFSRSWLAVECRILREWKRPEILSVQTVPFSTVQSLRLSAVILRNDENKAVFVARSHVRKRSRTGHETTVSLETCWQGMSDA